MEKEIKCKHQYDKVISKRHDMIKRYLTDNKYTVNIVEQEVVTIFCIYCGNSMEIQNSIGIVNDDN